MRLRAAEPVGGPASRSPPLAPTRSTHATDKSCSASSGPSSVDVCPTPPLSLPARSEDARRLWQRPALRAGLGSGPGTRSAVEPSRNTCERSHEPVVTSHLGRSSPGESLLPAARICSPYGRHTRKVESGRKYCLAAMGLRKAAHSQSRLPGGGGAAGQA